MTTRTFTSNADKIRYYMKELLEDGNPHTVSEIKRYVNKEAEYTFGPGTYAGAIRSLMLNSQGAYVSPSRGVYQKASIESESVDFAQKAIQILQKSRQEIQDSCNINLLEATDLDVKVADVLRKVLIQIDKAEQEIKHIRA